MAQSIVTPLRYPGGKTKLYLLVKELIKVNNCKTYIEPYAGGAGVALKLWLMILIKLFILFGIQY